MIYNKFIINMACHIMSLSLLRKNMTLSMASEKLLELDSNIMAQ